MNEPKIHYWRMILGGLIFSAFIIGLKVLTQQNVSFWTSLLVFTAGALTGQLSGSQDRSIIKTIIFHAVLVFILWTILTPIAQGPAGTIIVKKAEITSIIIIILILLERDVLNALKKPFKRPSLATIGPIGGILILILLTSTLGLGTYITYAATHYWWVILIGLIIWWIFLFKGTIKFLIKHLKTHD